MTFWSEIFIVNLGRFQEVTVKISNFFDYKFILNLFLKIFFHKNINSGCKSLSFNQTFLLQVCGKRQWRTLEDFNLERNELEWLIIFPWMNVATKIKIQTHSLMPSNLKQSNSILNALINWQIFHLNECAKNSILNVMD